MSDLTAEARRENALALANAAGVPVAEASRLLELSVLISHDASSATASRLAIDVAALLSRTVDEVRTEYTCDPSRLEIVIGNARRRDRAALPVYASLSEEGLRVAVLAPSQGRLQGAVHPLLVKLAACYLAGVALSQALGKALPFAKVDPFVLSFAELGIPLEQLDVPVHLDSAFLAGAGAIGNGFLWAAQHTNVRGELVIVDDDVVEAGNLNRQVWFTRDDIGHYKASQLVALAQPYFPALRLSAENTRLQNVPQKTAGPWLSRLFVAVDSRRARRELQNEFPREVFDASTTDVRELVSFYYNYSDGLACLACIYRPDEEESTRERHIAESLGVGVDDVRTERISLAVATVIQRRFPAFSLEALEGVAYDTLFKRLCAQGELPMANGERVLAPFAFVSCLAGVVLVIDLLRRTLLHANGLKSNYWRLSAWHPPLERRRQTHVKLADCAFCSSPLLRSVADDLWAPS